MIVKKNLLAIPNNIKPSITKVSMSPKLKIPVWICVFFITVTGWPVHAFSQDLDPQLNYRYPKLYNSNAVAGRLYLQPIGPYEDQVLQDLHMDLSLSVAAGYRPYFNDAADSYDPMRYNTNLLTMRASKGFIIDSREIEVGGILRIVQDNDSSFLSDFLRWFHRVIGSKGHIPDDVPYGAVVGNGHASLVGGSGNVYLLAPEFYTKIQILAEQKKNKLPNLSLKLSCRIPVSSDDFDTWGFGLSMGATKQFARKFRYKAAMALVYQDLSATDFNATDLDVASFAYDFFGGIGYDFGKKGGFYSDLGLRYSNERVAYKDNPDSATAAVVVHGGINYLSENRNWEIFTSLGEEITGISHALEPDFILCVGISLKF